jgi:hypothetical protein
MEWGRTCIAQKIPNALGLVDYPRVRVVDRDIHLRPSRANQEQGNQRKVDFQGEHGRGARSEERGKVARIIFIWCEQSLAPFLAPRLGPECGGQHRIPHHGGGTVSVGDGGIEVFCGSLVSLPMVPGALPTNTSYRESLPLQCIGRPCPRRTLFSPTCGCS